MIDSETISNLLIGTFLEDDDFIFGFCLGCPLIIREYDRQYCPSNFTPCDGDCRKKENLDHIEAIITEIAETVTNSI